MTAADCCVGSISGLAYIKPGSDKCHTCIGNFLPTDSLSIIVADLTIILICIVFGWLQNSYSGDEQELPHEVMIGFQKGAHCQQAQHDLAFTIEEGIGRFGSRFAIILYSSQYNFYCVHFIGACRRFT